MKLKSVSIGRLSTKNNVFVAPLAGFSDSAFRSICYSLGAGLCFNEMVSAKGMIYNSNATAELLRTADNEYIKAAQIFGNDKDVMLAAIRMPQFEKFDIVDVNFGCPVPKVFNNGEGSALLNEPQVAESIVENLVKSGKIITVKMRLGIDADNNVAVEFGKRMEAAGASMITLHARYRLQYYSGEPDFSTCEKLKSAVKVPVIFNGGVFTLEDADRAMDRTGADGVMLARGALKTPWLIAELTGNKPPDKKTLIKNHITELADICGERVAAVNFRKQMALYLKNVRGGKKLKETVFAATTVKEYFDVIDAADFDGQ